MTTHDRLSKQGCHQDQHGHWICDTPEQIPSNKKKVAVWGSARTSPDSGLYNSIRRMGRELSEDGWIVVTGGGPGSMEAANQGALEVCPEGEICSVAEAIY